MPEHRPRRRGRRLRNLTIDRIDRVASPDNPGALVRLAKARGEPGDRPGTEPTFQKRGDPMPPKLTKSRVHDVIEKRAEELRTTRPELTREMAILEVVKREPHLGNQYRAAKSDAEVAAESAPSRGREASLRNAASDRLAEAVDVVQAERGCGFDEAYDVLIKTDPLAADLEALRTAPEGHMPHSQGLAAIEKRLGRDHRVAKSARAL